jgi:hypothetical protein
MLSHSKEQQQQDWFSEQQNVGTYDLDLCMEQSAERIAKR